MNKLVWQVIFLRRLNILCRGLFVSSKSGSGSSPQAILSATDHTSFLFSKNVGFDIPIKAL